MRDYTTPAGNEEKRPFTINGTIFECVPALKADALRTLFGALCGDENGRISYDDHLKGFFAIVMEPAEMERFEAFFNEPDNIVHINLLYQIAQDLFEDYAGVPFVERFNSLATRLTAGKSSTDASDSAEGDSKR